MRLPCLSGAAAALLCCLSTVSAQTSPLPPEVQAALARAKVPADSLVVSIQEVGTAAPRLSWQPLQPVKPASLMKLLTTAAALEVLGPAYTWSTPVWLQGPLANGVLEGNLVIKGSGDPKLVVERMWLLLRRVQQLGVREIRGDIVLDRSAFSVPEQDPSEFDGEPFRPYNVNADALLLNYKSVALTFTPDAVRGVANVSSEPPLAGVRVDTTVPLTPGACGDWRGALKPDFSDENRIRFSGGFATSCNEKQWYTAYAGPKSYSGRALAGMWRDMGGKLVGRAREGQAPATPPNFELPSPPLADVVRDINKYSNNVMAQQLFLTLGLTQRGRGTPEAAREVVAQWLQERHGESALGTVVNNGSGLSRESRLSAQLLARVLQSSWGSPVMSELMSSLPVTGMDGTLRRTRYAPAGRAHLKTGSLNDVTGLAGYVLGDSGKRYVLVAIVNHANAAAARPALDLLVQWAAADGAPRLAPPALAQRK
ncbi:MAG: hypothetical protein RLZZ618_1013 [Pseudomonadota bacterium]|jgi:D-alanyl-D-alanine carboxypeptidase/D-alanyl-D-alanine-endopeptidase (penicillin-binding protein 4)